MRKNNVKNPVANIAALATMAVVSIAVKVMIKKYHKTPELFY